MEGHQCSARLVVIGRQVTGCCNDRAPSDRLVW